jgi:S-DNA-T family DNA segregation ATPase FtsK/SpoIIIE
VKLILIDPKMLELSVYNGIPHLLAPVVTEPRKAVAALNWVVREMEERYRRMSLLNVRSIETYNNALANAARQGRTPTRRVQTGFDRRTGQPNYVEETLDLTPMPFIVVVIDEMADLMLTAGKDIEAAVQRLAQMARAAGIHLITATQRPSVDVITGTIKANLPSRISFKVASKIDSRTILGDGGAEQLLGAGDMLYSLGGTQVSRVHGAFVADEEVEQVTIALRAHGRPSYVDAITAEPEDATDGADEDPKGSGDELYDRAIAIVLKDRKVSTSYIQRRLQIGYNRAADLIERMEQDGIISPPNGAGKRHILAGEAASA